MAHREFPVPANEAERLLVVREFAFLEDSRRVGLERLCRLAVDMFGVESASVALVGEREVTFLTSTFNPSMKIAREDALCSRTILQDDLHEIPDLAHDHWGKTSFLAASEGVCFYAGMPLAPRQGVNVGALCLVGRQPRRLSLHERRQFQALSLLVLEVMQLHLQSESLRWREAVLGQSSKLAKVGGWEFDLLRARFRLSDELCAIGGLARDMPCDIETLSGIVVARDRPRFLDAFEALRRHGEPFDLDLEMVGERHHSRWVRAMGQCELHDGQIARLFGAVQDVTDRKVAEKHIRHLAHHDALTGLPNRELFNQRLEEAIDEEGQRHGKFALMLLDFDNFKTINDTKGHAVGDRILEVVADRLSSIMGRHNTVARLGGDEFALILRGIRNAADVTAKTDEILEALKRSITVGVENIKASVSIGTTLFPDHHRSANELLKNADIALYLAKSGGRGKAELFTPELRHKFDERLALVEEVRRGIEADEFVLYYQPICAVTEFEGRKLEGFEALMRWDHPRLGILTPAFFGIAFEEHDLARDLGEIGLRQAVARISEWSAAGIEFGYVAINVAPEQFASGHYFERLAEVVEAAEMRPGSLMVEVTESVYLGRDAQKNFAALGRLHGLGVRIALDDFGTGYAALTNLKQFPVDLMKIDRSFIRRVGVDEGDTAIAKAVINLGHAMGIGVVAEGVERSDQAYFLSRNGCRSMQGYFFAQAMPPEHVSEFVSAMSQGQLTARPQLVAC